MATYFIRQTGFAAQGPFDEERIRANILLGRVRAGMEISPDGERWMAVEEHRLFAPAAPDAAPVAAPTPPARGGHAVEGRPPPAPARRPSDDSNRDRGSSRRPARAADEDEPSRGRRSDRREERGRTRRTGRPSTAVAVTSLVLGLLVVVGAVVAIARRGGDSRPAAAPPVAATWIPPGAAIASSEAWTEALRRWRPAAGAKEGPEIEAAAATIRAASDGARKAFRRAALESLRAGPADSAVARLAKAVDGSVWRVRPALKAAKWRGLDDFRVLEPYADGGLAVATGLSAVDAAIGRVVRYEKTVADGGVEAENDAIRAQADPSGAGLAVDDESGGIWWLAAKGKDVDAAAALAQTKLWAAAIRFVWPFASTARFPDALGTKRVVLVLDPAAKHYDSMSDERGSTAGVARIPHGDSVEARVAAATALTLAAYDLAFRLDCSRNRDNLRHALAMRWGMAFAAYEADLKPDSFPVMRDRGRDALKKALGAAPSVPAWDVVLEAALQEDVYRADQARVADLEPVPRAAYVFLAYRMIMRWQIMEPWNEAQMRALAEEKPIPIGRDPDNPKKDVMFTWREFAGTLASIERFNRGYAAIYVPYVLRGDRAEGGSVDGR